jgi:alkylation response protein AidB-like acyl-CoA dehydrogenase
MFLIDYPNPNIILKSPLQILGFDEAPHGVCEVEFNNVYVPKENMLGKEGSAFAMA